VADALTDDIAVATPEAKPLITALVPAFGGKRNLAGQIAAELGEHRTRWVLCAGSMALELSLPPCVMETSVDLHGDLTNLARVVQDPRLCGRLYRRLRRTWMHETLFADSDRIIRQGERDGTAARLADGCGSADERLERAYHYFLVSWQGRNGTALTPASHKGTFCVRYTNRGGHAGKRWTGAVDSIPAWGRRMRSITILRRCLFAVAERIDDEPRAVIYCDPPYLVKGCTYLHDDNAGRPESVGDDEWRTAVAWASVQREGDRAGVSPQRLAWHKCLADRLRRFRQTRVVVSYYDHPILRDLYPCWTKRRLTAAKAMVSAGRRGNTGHIDAPEVLLLNGPSLVEPVGGLTLFAVGGPA
jgi:DNA adenine methylase